MAARFNTPPGWPTPPEGWTPPDGWEPDPSWPPAPPEWQFWIDDAAPDDATHLAGGGFPPPDPGQQPTEQMGQQPTQQMGQQPTQQMGQQPTQQLYSYAGSTGLDQPGASPYAAGGAGGYGQPGGYPPGGPQEQKKNTGVLVGVAIGAVVLLGLIIWGVFALVNRGGDEEPTADPTVTTEPAPEPTTDEQPTEEPTETEEPTDEPTDEPSDGPSASEGGVVDLEVGDAAEVTDEGTVIGEITVAEIEADWSPDEALCGEPTEEQYIALNLHVETNGKIGSEGYFFTGFEFTALDDGGNEVGSGSTITGIFCLSDSDQIDTDWTADQSYDGWLLIDAGSGATDVTYTEWLAFDDVPVYRWAIP